MLIELKLKNVALIEIIEINFEKGLNVLTGDSGSGKSLILDSLNVLFGGTNIPLNHLIRPGKDYCVIESKFSSSSEINNWLINNGFQENLTELIIKRKSVKRNNKVVSKYTLNDLTINKKLIQELGRLLLDFAGQSDSVLFDSQEYRRLIIDELGSKELEETNLNIKCEWKKYNTLKGLMLEKIEFSKKQEENNLAIKDMFHILDQANLTAVDEILELESQEKKLANSLEINNSIQLSLNNLNNFSDDEPSVAALIDQSIKSINKIAEFDLKINEFREKFCIIQGYVENLIFEINSYAQQEESSDISLEDIQKRLFFLKNLERTFSMDLPQLIEKRDHLKSYLLSNVYEEEINKLEVEINNLEIHLNSLFAIQSEERKGIANRLQDSVMSILKNLGLGNAKFAIEFEKINPSCNGTDNINFFFSANPDQKLAPLSKVISGGEMSRFLLAIKSSISKKPNTFFLDEIDSGLSGKSLFSLVELIKVISKDQQVLCITHQPCLAAAAKAHFKVTKKVINGLTYTSISKLMSKKDRQGELIELIGGGFGEANDYASILLDRAAA